MIRREPMLTSRPTARGPCGAKQHGSSGLTSVLPSGSAAAGLPRRAWRCLFGHPSVIQKSDISLAVSGCEAGMSQAEVCMQNPGGGEWHDVLASAEMLRRAAA